MPRLRLDCGQQSLTLQTLDTPTAAAIVKALPIDSTARTWGDEIYFSTGVDVPLEADARQIIEAGEIAFWVEGSCIAIGFGPTPISQADEIRLAARTNIWATALTSVSVLATVSDGDTIQLDLLAE